MSNLTAKDVRARPGEFVIVARSARGHAHIPVDEFDRLLEGIGATAAAVEALPASPDPAVSQEVEQIKLRQESQEKALQALAEGLDGIARKVNAIFEIAAETAKGRAA